MNSAEAAAGPAVDLARTYGALLLGASLAFGLSGIVFTQCVVYFKQYPKDAKITKAMVGVSWILDMTHTCFVVVAIYEYFVKQFTNTAHIDEIPWALALSVVTTALQTLLVHLFFAEKIHRSSQNNWLITAPIVVLAILRLGCATTTTANMIRLGRFSAFMIPFPRAMFTTGLSLSAIVDILITGWVCYFLREIRTRIGPQGTIMIRTVDTLTLYTLENGALTCFAAIASLVCWLSMPHNLIFMGLHFIISKLYANSLLASLNMRNELRHIHGRVRYGIMTGATSDWAKDQGPESALRIQNSKSLGTSDSHEHYPLNPRHHHHPQKSDTPYYAAPTGAAVASGGAPVGGGAAGGGARNRRSRIPHEPTTIIQFRPASPTYWNIVAGAAATAQPGGPPSSDTRSPMPPTTTATTAAAGVGVASKTNSVSIPTEVSHQPRGTSLKPSVDLPS